MSDTTAQHIEARNDEDLMARLVAVAEQKHIADPEGFVRANLGRLVSTEIEEGVTLTTVHAYAADQYRHALAALPPKPGINPAAVTDSQLHQAVTAVWDS